jgi:predicted DNA-binding antitoxin AbrB/MazE fold protein
MPNTIEAVVKNGQFVPIESITWPDGTKAIVTIVDDDEREFWLSASEESLNAIWDNEEDDVYAELLSK